MPARKLDWLLTIVRLVAGGFFVYASLDKIIHPDAFAKIVHNYRILPGEMINIFAIILPWLELLCGMALVLGTRIHGASAILASLTVVFIVAVTNAMARGIKIDCGCFSTSGEGARQVGMPLLIEDTVLLILILLIWIKGAGRWALDRVNRNG
jgi:uncharacterized membrane protein YphA (DoxX/SURF4 family)